MNNRELNTQSASSLLNASTAIKRKRPSSKKSIILLDSLVPSPFVTELELSQKLSSTPLVVGAGAGILPMSLMPETSSTLIPAAAATVAATVATTVATTTTVPLISSHPISTSASSSSSSLNDIKKIVIDSHDVSSSSSSTTTATHVPTSTKEVKSTVDGSNAPETSKTLPKAPIAPGIVATRVIAILLSDDPVSVLDLSKALPDVNKDAIQYVMDTLNVLGIVAPLRYQSKFGMSDDQTKPPQALTGTTAPTATVYYSFVGFGKGIEDFDFNTIEELTRKSRARTMVVKERIKTFQNISSRNISKRERILETKLALTSAIESDSDLIDDMLYQDFTKELANKP